MQIHPNRKIIANNPNKNIIVLSKRLGIHNLNTYKNSPADTHNCYKGILIHKNV